MFVLVRLPPTYTFPAVDPPVESIERLINELRDNVTGRVDYFMSTKNSFAATYAWNRDILDRPDADTTYDKIPSVQNDDHVYVLERGKVVEHGSWNELVAMHGRFDELRRLQALDGDDRTPTAPGEE